MKDTTLNKITDWIMVVIFAIILGVLYKFNGFEIAMLYAVTMLMYRCYRIQSKIEEIKQIEK